MRSVSNEYKLAITQPKEITAEIRYNDLILDEDTINSINYNVNCDYFKTVMQQVNLDIDNQIAIDTDINVKFGVRVNDVYEFVDYGKYKIYGLESNKDTKSYKAVCYDKMLDSMVDYDIKIPDNTPIRDVWILIFNELGWDTSVIPEVFINSSKVLPFDCWTGLKMSYRDVLDELCTISCVWLADFNGIVKMVQINNTNEVIDEEYLSDTNVTIGDKIFFNSVVFSRSAESDNIYRKNDISISENGLHEFKIKDYQILNGNNRDDFIDEMFEYLKTLEFYFFDVQTKGITFLEKIDGFNFQIEDKIYPVIMLNNETNITSGLSEHTYADKPKESQTDYKYADITDKSIAQALIIADKQNAQIRAEVKETQENSVGKDDIVASLNLAIENGQGIVKFTSNQFLVESDKLKIDETGKIVAGDSEFNNAILRGGNLLLKDDGSSEGASIKIETLTHYSEEITLNDDLSNQLIFSNFEGLTYEYIINNFSNFPIELISSENYKIVLNVVEARDGNLAGFWLTDSDGVILGALQAVYEDNRLETDGNYELPADFGNVTYINPLSITQRIKKDNAITRETAYSGYGVQADIISDFNYTSDDVEYVAQKKVEGEFTPEDIIKYDTNKDGTINAVDLSNIQRYVLSNITPTNPGKFIIDTHAIRKNIQFKDGDGNEKLTFGLDGIYMDGNSLDDLYGSNNILWQANNAEGGYYMTAEHTATLNEKISEQAHGIILVWWAFNPETRKLVGGPVAQQVIPKYLISDTVMTFHQDMHYANFTYSGTKVVNISDNSIKGNDTNTATGTGGSGIKYNNNRFVLTHVIGF